MLPTNDHGRVNYDVLVAVVLRVLLYARLSRAYYM
jgi:hypothetical protein